MLLYDEINSKGFEGDHGLINGFAEFIRNLLYAKMKELPALLEVVESHSGQVYRNREKSGRRRFLSAALEYIE